MIRTSTESRSAVCLAVASLILLGGCNDPVSTGAEPTHLEILQDVPPVGLPDAPLLDTLRVRLVDDQGRPQAGQLLTWVIRLGGGSVAPLEETTDADGVAAAVWTLGPASGPNEVEVRTPQDSAATWHTNAEALRVDQLDSNYGLGCGLKQGDLWCWGESWVSTPAVSNGPENVWGMIYPAPGLVAEGGGFTDLAVGDLSVCALDPTGIARCYGFYPEVTPLPAVPAMRRIAGGQTSQYCGVTLTDSTAWCWNVRDGSAAPVPASPAFVDLEMESGVGGQRTIVCGRLVDSTAACWGDGPLGDGTFDPSTTPVPVSGGLHFAELAVGEDFACGRQVSGDVWCWGRNERGQLGSQGPDSPVPILAATGVSRVSAALQMVLALRYGTLVRWGHFGNSEANPITPLSPVPDLPVADFSANDLSCMRLIDGQAYCWAELWLNASSFDWDRYLPVQPVAE
jgi:hypothetical protein